MTISAWDTVPIEEWVAQLYSAFGQRKPMGEPAPNSRTPHYFLLRTFLGDNDLLIIFNSKRCRYNCHFCQLPRKSPNVFVPGDDLLAQFRSVLLETKHSLSIVERLTLSNEGSILDSGTFPTDALMAIGRCVQQLRRVRTLVLETRIEFVDRDTVGRIRMMAQRPSIDILTGFETHDVRIRDEILLKQQPLATFERGLEEVANSGATLSSYVLFKPSQTMTDDEAYVEAERSIDYLVDQCQRRGVKLNYIRLNPMYAAKGSYWATVARQTQEYKPPRLTDVMRLAQNKAKEGVRIYIGLSTEGLGEKGYDYTCREDYSTELIKAVKLFNDMKISSFEGI